MEDNAKGLSEIADSKEERGFRCPFSSKEKGGQVGLGLILLWGAIVLLADITGIAANPHILWWDGWTVFLIGAGIIALAEGLIRLVVPGLRHGAAFSLFAGAFLIVIGIDNDIVWSVLIVSALSIIGLSLIFRRNSDKEKGGEING